MSADHSLLWEPIARDFERHAATSPHNALYDRPAVVDLCGDVRGQSVLDLGCGPGFYAEALLAGGAHEITGLDSSPTMIELARRRNPVRAAFRVHDLEQPLNWLGDESFDLVVMALVIHHLDDRVAVLREIHRVLRPAGRLVVSTHHPTSDWQLHGGSYFDVSVIEETWKRGWEVRYWRQPLTASASEFAEAGFVIERLVEPRPVPGMAETSPEEFEMLSTQPGFIAFRLGKLGTGHDPRQGARPGRVDAERR